MKKLIKKNSDKKIALILLIIMLFNIIVPNYSNAGLITSLLGKPIATLGVILIDGINRMLSLTFALDAKLVGTVNDVTTAWEASQTDNGKGFLEKMQDGLDAAADIWYNILLSPDDIFAGNVKIANANIFTANNSGIQNLTSFGHLIDTIKEAVAGLYYIMRNLGATILLCLLIYCGIRIVLSSNNASEKAKWKMYLFDWLKALTLVMFVHVLMIGIFYISEVIVDGLKQSITIHGDTIVASIRREFNATGIFDGGTAFIYLGMYGYVTYLTIVFLIAYFKRFLYVMVMIVVAPIISALYALGKTTKSIFNNWFKEFTFGVLVQPFHMLIYTVLITMPIRVLRSGNIVHGTFVEGTVLQNAVGYTTIDVKLYAIFALSSIRPLERYMRRIFGFGHTQLDNMASYESGKKTIDKGKQVVKQTVDTVAKVALAVATGGATAAAGGATAAAGGATAAAGGATQAAQGLGGLTEAADAAQGLAGATEQLGGGMGDNMPFLSDLSPELVEEGNLLDSEDQALWDLTPDPDNMGDWTDADEQALNELYKEQIQRRDDYDARKEEYFANKSNETSENNTNENAESKTNGQDVVFNNANVQMQADSLEGILDTGAIESTTLDSENLKDAIQEASSDVSGEDTLGDANGKGKMKLGDYLAIALQDTLAGIDNVKGKVNEKKGQFEEKHKTLTGMAKALESPDVQNSIQDLKSAFHELGDTMFMPGDADPSIWKTDIDYKKTIIKKNEENLKASFVNDKENQNKIIAKHELEDKVDKKTGQVIKSKEDQAKEILEKMMPYASAGVTDVDQIMKLQTKGNDVESAMKQNLRDNIQEKAATARVQKFNTTNNIQVMRTIAADKMNIPQERRSDPKVIQQITQQVNQDIKEGAKYITSGAAKDPETLHRLMELEKKIDKRIDTTGISGASKVQSVSNADKIVEKALQKKLKEIKVAGADKNAGAKELQNVLNGELEKRRKAAERKSDSKTKPIGDGGKK